MARARPTYERKPGIMDRLRKRPPPRQPAEVEVKHSKNPITGTHKTTKTTKPHAHAHAGSGPVQHQRRKPGLGDKVSGALMKMKGSAEHKPGVKAAGTRRMHGTDGKGAHRAY